VGYFDADFVAGLVLEDGALAFLSSAFEAFFAAAALPSLESFDCSFATFDSAFTSFFLALVNLIQLSFFSFFHSEILQCTTFPQARCYIFNQNSPSG